MELTTLGCFGGEAHGRHSSGFLIDGTILLEAGSVTTTLSGEEQLAVTHILISHAHLDHTKELIFLVDNLYIRGVRNVRLLGIPAVVEQLRLHLFNDQLWPDFTRIPREGKPILLIEELVEGAENQVAHLTVTPVLVTHTVPASGFIIRSGSSVVVYTGDTGPTTEIWRRARAIPDLTAVIVETSFPDERRALALESGHLTPALLAIELDKLGRPEVPVHIAHMKPAFVERITAELAALGDPRIVPLVQDKTYHF
jgi:cAMP phosphodiesterase